MGKLFFPPLYFSSANHLEFTPSPVVGVVPCGPQLSSLSTGVPYLHFSLLFGLRSYISQRSGLASSGPFWGLVGAGDGMDRYEQKFSDVLWLRAGLLLCKIELSLLALVPIGVNWARSLLIRLTSFLGYNPGVLKLKGGSIIPYLIISALPSLQPQHNRALSKFYSSFPTPQTKTHLWKKFKCGAGKHLFLFVCFNF